MNTEIPVRHFLLRDDSCWLAELVGLDRLSDGSLKLARVPAPDQGESIRLPGPYEVDPSGIAVDQCGRIYSSNAAEHRIHMQVPECDFNYTLKVDSAPAGMAVHGETLYVADPANARILCFLVPSLELRRVIEGEFTEPTGLVVDSEERLYVLDRGTKTVLRFLSNGTADAIYNVAMATHVSLMSPVFFTIGRENILYVSDSAANAILSFGEDGTALPSLDTVGKPRALTASTTRLYAVDAETGEILVYDSISGEHIGEIPDFHAPVTAMELDHKGHLHLKHDAGEIRIRLNASSGCVKLGTVTAGPLDAGVVSDWERVVADVQDAGLELRAIIGNRETPAPSVAQWNAPEALLPSSDALLFREALPTTHEPGEHRFLWLRATLFSEDGRSGPRLQQLRAQTVGISLMEKLPRIYRRDDAEEQFLERLLALVRSEFEDWDVALKDVPRRIDPMMVPVDELTWLSNWLAFELPQGRSQDALRNLITRLPELYASRGTLAGLSDFAEIYSGLRPRIIEAYRSRRIWQLADSDTNANAASMLGFDTALAAASPEGFIVPGQVRTDPAYAGLRGDYYAGFEFDRHVFGRSDRTIDFDTDNSVIPEESGVPLDTFSVRWTGQIKSLFSETYLFSIEPASGVRLWIDGYPLIDTWNSTTASKVSERFLMDADLWHAIMLEVHRSKGGKELRLLWSSRSQQEETVPEHSLYSVLDDRADLSTETEAIVDIGNAVVGESGPLPASEYGSMLFTEHAHLFTVLAPAGCCDARRREALREVIEAEKPAHSDYHLCFVEPRMRVGFQARLGIDAIVANGPLPLRLGEGLLGKDSFLDAASPGGARVNEHARLGQDTVIG